MWLKEDVQRHRVDWNTFFYLSPSATRSAVVLMSRENTRESGRRRFHHTKINEKQQKRAWRTHSSLDVLPPLAPIFRKIHEVKCEEVKKPAHTLTENAAPRSKSFCRKNPAVVLIPGAADITGLN